MCLCVLFLPFSTCYFDLHCDELCCRCVSDNCLMNYNLGLEECGDCCCCVQEDLRGRLCSACYWYRACCPRCAPGKKEAANLPAELPVQTVMNQSC